MTVSTTRGQPASQVFSCRIDLCLGKKLLISADCGSVLLKGMVCICMCTQFCRAWKALNEWTGVTSISGPTHVCWAALWLYTWTHRQLLTSQKWWIEKCLHNLCCEVHLCTLISNTVTVCAVQRSIEIGFGGLYVPIYFSAREICACVCVTFGIDWVPGMLRGLQESQGVDLL